MGLPVVWPSSAGDLPYPDELAECGRADLTGLEPDQSFYISGAQRVLLPANLRHLKPNVFFMSLYYLFCTSVSQCESAAPQPKGC